MQREGNSGLNKYVQFDGTNFNNWKFRIEVLLDEKGLLEYLETPLVDLVEAAEGDLDSEQRIKLEEKKCKSLLVQCIHDSQLEYIKDKREAKDIYDALKSIFERQSIAGQLLLRKQILTMKYVDGEEMNKHFLKFDKNVRDLKSIGATMEEMDIICHLLLTLPKSFDTLVTAIETIDPKNLTLDFVKSRILDEFAKRNVVGNSKEKAVDFTAMSANKVKPTCFKCGKIGHIQFQCLSKGNAHGNRSGRGYGHEKGANAAEEKFYGNRRGTNYTRERGANAANREESDESDASHSMIAVSQAHTAQQQYDDENEISFFLD